MGNSIYDRYKQEGRNAFLLDLVNQGHRNSWLKGKITAELETIATPPDTGKVKAVKTQPQRTESTTDKAVHSVTPRTKINTFNLTPELQALYKKAVTAYRETAAIHNELAVDIYEQANMISQDKRAEMITEVVERRAWAIKVFDRCRVYEQTGTDPGDDAKPELDETNPLAVFKKIQSLRSSISRFKKNKSDAKAKAAATELERLEDVYKGLTHV